MITDQLKIAKLQRILDETFEKLIETEKKLAASQERVNTLTIERDRLNSALVYVATMPRIHKHTRRVVEAALRPEPLEP